MFRKWSETKEAFNPGRFARQDREKKKGPKRGHCPCRHYEKEWETARKLNISESSRNSKQKHTDFESMFRLKIKTPLHDRLSMISNRNLRFIFFRCSIDWFVCCLRGGERVQFLIAIFHHQNIYLVYTSIQRHCRLSRIRQIKRPNCHTNSNLSFLCK